MIYFLGYTVVFVVIITNLLIVYFGRNYNYWKKKGVPYLDPGRIFGNFYEVFIWKKSISDILGEIYRNNSDRFMGIYILDRPFLVVNDLDLIKKILVKDFSHFVDRSVQLNHKTDPIGDNTLFLSHGSTWVKQRKRLSPVFSTGKLKSKAPGITELGKTLSKYIRTSLEENNNIIDAKKSCAKYVIDALTFTFYGLKHSCLKNEQNPFIHFAETTFNWKQMLQGLKLSYLYIAQSILPLFHVQIIDENAEIFFRKFTWDLISDRENRNCDNNDLIDILKHIKESEKIDDPNTEDGDLLTSLVVNIFGAGFDSTSTTISYALYELAKHPEIQEQARNEVRDVLQRDGHLTYSNIQTLSYLYRVISETLRLYPIVSFIDRKCTKDYQIPETDVILDKGQLVYIPVLAIHKDPNYFPDPECFNPDRFLPECVRERHDFAYLPFGQGPRKCPSVRFAKFVTCCGLASILCNYELKICEKTHKAAEVDKRSIFTQAVDGIYLQFTEVTKII